MDSKGKCAQGMLHKGKNSQQLFPLMPVVEIAGNSRVLVENHCGIHSYQTASICVKVKTGGVQVQGTDLRIQYMTRYRLVITGKIASVALLPENAL